MELLAEPGEAMVRVRVSGEVTAETCGDLRLAVLEMLGKKPRNVTLDLSDVPFMDTSGVGVLVGLRAHMKPLGATLQIESASPRVRQVLAMTKLTELFGLREG